VLEEEFVKKVLSAPIFEFMLNSLRDDNILVVQEATYCFSKMLKYGIPEVAMALSKTSMLPDIIKLIEMNLDANTLHTCLLIIWEMLSISAHFEEHIKDSTIKDFINSLDGLTVISRLTVNNLTYEVSQLAENILLRFYNVEQIS
jgi:hypothetical protein